MDVNAADIAEEVHISSFYLQKGFKLVTGYSIGEYMRCRRLYLAALDVLTGRGKVFPVSVSILAFPAFFILSFWA